MPVEVIYLLVQLVFDGSSVNRLNLPKSGGKDELMETIQMSTTINQAPRIVNFLLACIEFLITMARSIDMASTVSTLALAVLTVRKPKV